MTNQTLIAIAVGALVIIVLAISLKRGRFATPQRKTKIALQELADSEVPKGAIAKGPANALGHNGEMSQLRGMGVLWLSDTTLGFVLRRPQRNFNISLADVQSVVASTEFSRIGLTQTSEQVEFLIVSWTDPSGRAVIGFKVADAGRWAEQVNDALVQRRRLR